MAMLCVIVLSLWGSPAQADRVREQQWHLQYLRAAEAVGHSNGQGVAVAVIDSGVDANHPDLANAVLPGADMAGSGDGRIDVDGHGTAMAGLIAARGRPGQVGAFGIAPQSSILPLKTGGPDNPFVAEAIDFAIGRATVICLALGGDEGTRLEQAIGRAIASDIVVVAAAGNRPHDKVQAPARYPGVVATVGIGRSGERADISVAGPEATLAAPAVEIVSTNTGGGYRIGTGTSDATAIIAGVAALVRSKFPELSAPEVIHRMTATAIDKGPPGRDDEYGFGIVDPVAALTANVAPLASSGPSIRPSPGEAQPPSGKDDNIALIGILIGTLIAAGVVVGGAATLLYLKR